LFTKRVKISLKKNAVRPKTNQKREMKKSQFGRD